MLVPCPRCGALNDQSKDICACCGRSAAGNPSPADLQSASPPRPSGPPPREAPRADPFALRHVQTARWTIMVVGVLNLLIGLGGGCLGKFVDFAIDQAEAEEKARPAAAEEDGEEESEENQFNLAEAKEVSSVIWLVSLLCIALGGIFIALFCVAKGHPFEGILVALVLYAGCSVADVLMADKVSPVAILIKLGICALLVKGLQGARSLKLAAARS